MKSLLPCSVAVWAATLGPTPSLAAAAGAELAAQKNCLGCHSIASKVVGPAYKDIAARYAGQKDAAAALVLKVQKGGSGAWGVVPMPANTQLTDAEARALVNWILSLK